ncbi:glycogen debranching protein GlgX [Pasteurella skyensis]|uniref:Glycogen debranching protein GlgX n=1 Tax=Phocoenobacter skyensis TaxID=97481 RepID=A0AAJ6NC86_9PAST|nr:glycogen debranching protein GlgX [Pasteurella skyensis]MDP8162622.1 glycogen debranching protein GlgX [Pasteurella skyensis]MDP8169832.1 glycogen debranching protein GlgX [Pasteurella skyensis]MDP8172780.1 glycogen debranching protein GlgX [Pasteurella skyensis]MDP8174006.1 glycogen debranching protein GlgX [Pasteurella skyensis]MDP8179303.1 glycogen debranching protein GlgX [Pasteurella skyensis]
MKNITLGKPYPLGCTVRRKKGLKGFNFAIFSSQATAVELCIFDESNRQEIRLPMYRTEDIWHIWLADVSCGMKYGYRIYGSESSNPNKLILDPYAKAVVGKPDLSSIESRSWFLLSDYRDNAHLAPKGVVLEDKFEWEEDKSPNTNWAETIIYEVHIKGFTQLREDLPEEIRGTYAGLADPKMIAYLKDLGITAVELLPINYHIDEFHLQEKGLHNYWGYNPLAMFAVEPKYWSGRKGTSPLTEFKSMVKALHQAGIEVILDIVFNHSAESEKAFPTFSQRGIDDRNYYWRDSNSNYLNWTGCGNMLNLSSNVGRQWVVDCLRYWVEECHVDGFRFDLATTLGRETPSFNPQAQLFKDIEQVESLRHCKFIAEPWDLGEGGYQVGNFPVYFSEWNDHFRDDMCRFWLRKSGELGAFAERFAGSSNIYKKEGCLPHKSINFITAHDGFTLRDLVSYNHKHNLANGESNRDGRDENYSCNYGFEGSENAAPVVDAMRFSHSCALLSSLLLSNGTPMLLAGDEFGNTQYGNNNAYCQDNEIAWLKWNSFHKSLFLVVKEIIKIRKQIPSLSTDSWWENNNVDWLNVNGYLMSVDDWQNLEINAFQIMLDKQWLLLINGKAGLQQFVLPNGQWREISSCNTLRDNHFEVEDVAFSILKKVVK